MVNRFHSRAVIGYGDRDMNVLAASLERAQAYENEITKLREQVKAQAAVIERLTKRLASTNIIIEVVCAIHPDSACAKYELAENTNTLAIPTDSTQILDDVRRAERERIEKMIIGELFDSPLRRNLISKLRAMED